MKIATRFLLCSTLLWSLSSVSEAATIAAIKGTKAIVNLDGDQLKVGDSLYAINPSSGKKTGLVKVLQIKNDKAMVEIVKGKALKGGSLQAKSASGSTASNSTSGSASSSSRRNQEPTPDYTRAFESSKGNKSFGYHKSLVNSYGALGGLQINNMTIDNTKLTGTGMNLGGFYEYAFSDSLAVQGLGSFDQFNVENANTKQNVKIGYLSLYGLGKWYLLQTQYRAWVGGGFGFLYAMSKSQANALKLDSISSNQVFTVNFGLDYQLNRNHYIPVSFSYVIFPDSDKSVSGINSMQFKIGWGWNL